MFAGVRSINLESCPLGQKIKGQKYHQSPTLA